jgi:hypothetical protein
LAASTSVIGLHRNVVIYRKRLRKKYFGGHCRIFYSVNLINDNRVFTDASLLRTFDDEAGSLIHTGDVVRNVFVFISAAAIKKIMLVI